MTAKKMAARAQRGALKERHHWDNHTACCGTWRPPWWGCVPKGEENRMRDLASS